MISRKSLRACTKLGKHRGHHNMARREEGNMRPRRKSAFAQGCKCVTTPIKRMSETLLFPFLINTNCESNCCSHETLLHDRTLSTFRYVQLQMRSESDNNVETCEFNKSKNICPNHAGKTSVLVSPSSKEQAPALLSPYLLQTTQNALDDLSPTDKSFHMPLSCASRVPKLNLTVLQLWNSFISVISSMMAATVSPCTQMGTQDLLHDPWVGPRRKLFAHPS